MPDNFPTEIYQFLRDHIGTVAQLEVLLLMHRTPDRFWSVEEIAKSLYIPGTYSTSILEGLRKSGLVRISDRSQLEYQYKPNSTELARIVDELGKLYRERPVATIHAIHSAPMDTLQNFADAFRIRKPKGE